MKTTALVSLFFLLFAFTIAEVVLDSDGDNLHNGDTYMLSTIPNNDGGGIYPALISQVPSNACSLAVAKGFPYSRGWPVTISALETHNSIETTDQLRISFAYIPANNCTTNLNWVIKNSNGTEVVVVDDIDEGLVFQIASTSEKFTYYLVACSGEDLARCRNIGVQYDNNCHYLFIVTDGEPQMLQFDKDSGDGSFVSKSPSRLSMVV